MTYVYKERLEQTRNLLHVLALFLEVRPCGSKSFKLSKDIVWLQTTYYATRRTCRFANGMITCLLYTSPSPRDATLSRMPSSA